MVKRGDVVQILAGHDAGRYCVVLGWADGYPLLADGKLRTLQKPKRKNPKHLQAAGTALEERMLTSDRQIRKALHPFNYGQTAKL